MALARPDQPEVIALIGALDDDPRSFSPPERCHLLGVVALLRPKLLFAVARDGQGSAVGCAAIVLRAGGGELKRC